jgi:hypothetical protein
MFDSGPEHWAVLEYGLYRHGIENKLVEQAMADDSDHAATVADRGTRCPFETTEPSLIAPELDDTSAFEEAGRADDLARQVHSTALSTGEPERRPTLGRLRCGVGKTSHPQRTDIMGQRRLICQLEQSGVEIEIMPYHAGRTLAPGEMKGDRAVVKGSFPAVADTMGGRQRLPRAAQPSRASVSL